jgi:hypothetical protein
MRKWRDRLTRMGAVFDEICYVNGAKQGAGFMGIKLVASAVDAILAADVDEDVL